VVKSVDPENTQPIRDTILAQAGSPIRKEDCVDLVVDLSWINVAKALMPIYQTAAEAALGSHAVMPKHDL
jgi:hypothetical protein